MNKPRWKSGWPTKRGQYYVILECGDHVGIVVSPSTMVVEYEEVACLCANDYSDGVCFQPNDTKPLDQYWGRAFSHYGPIPKYRGKRRLDRKDGVR